MKKYIPKPIRGQTYPSYIHISIAQAKKLIANGQAFNGFMVGNKVNSFHFFHGWHLARRLWKCETLAELEAHINSFLFYLDPELGNRAVLYLHSSSL